jgi:hypothetical protein
MGVWVYGVYGCMGCMSVWGVWVYGVYECMGVWVYECVHLDYAERDIDPE